MPISASKWPRGILAYRIAAVTLGWRCHPKGATRGARTDQYGSGLFFQSVVSNIAPMGLLSRSLALLCIVLLALPSGWCCMIGAPCCDQRRPVEKRADQPAPLRHKSCCNHTTEQKHNDTTPAPKPSTPVKVCSCEKAPVVMPETTRLGPELFVAPLSSAVDSPSFNTGGQSESIRLHDPPSPSLRISHCVWLC